MKPKFNKVRKKKKKKKKHNSEESWKTLKNIKKFLLTLLSNRAIKEKLRFPLLTLAFIFFSLFHLDFIPKGTNIQDRRAPYRQVLKTTLKNVLHKL